MVSGTASLVPKLYGVGAMVGIQQNIVFCSCTPNFAADVFGVTNFTQRFDQGGLLQVYKIVAYRHVFIGS